MPEFALVRAQAGSAGASWALQVKKKKSEAAQLPPARREKLCCGGEGEGAASQRVQPRARES